MIRKNLYILLTCFFVYGIAVTGVAQQNSYKEGSPEWLVDMFF